MEGQDRILIKYVVVELALSENVYKIFTSKKFWKFKKHYGGAYTTLL